MDVATDPEGRVATADGIAKLVSGAAADPAADFADLLDTDTLARVAGWHFGFGGEVHATAEAVELVEADALWMAVWSGKAVARG